MPETVSPAIDYQLVSENCGHFAIEPLEPGYGLTLGNAMRRVLLGSLPGAAVTAVKIDGIQHEFSTIPHMKEDTLEFLLNVKGIRLRYLSDRSDKLTLQAFGDGEVRAGDIKPSADFEIINPEHHLATLDSAEARLNVEFTIEVGKGYIPAGPSDGRPLGVLPMDAVFTPIRRVNYKVEKTRVEDRSDYDRLILDVWTDGTISPEDAIAESARILVQQFSTFCKLGKFTEEAIAVVEKPQLASGQHDMTLDQLGLSSRTFNALRRGGITDMRTLLGKSRDELVSLKNFGQKSWDEVQERLAEAGIGKKPQAIESEQEDKDQAPSEEKPAEDVELEEMKRKLQEKFTVREEK